MRLVSMLLVLSTIRAARRCHAAERARRTGRFRQDFAAAVLAVDGQDLSLAALLENRYI